MKIKKFEKIVATWLYLHDKTENVIHIRNLNEALNHGLASKLVHREIKFNQKAWLKPCIDMNTDLRKSAKNDFEKYFFKLMNNSVFEKSLQIFENI